MTWNTKLALTALIITSLGSELIFARNGQRHARRARGGVSQANETQNSIPNTAPFGALDEATSKEIDKKFEAVKKAALDAGVPEDAFNKMKDGYKSTYDHLINKDFVTIISYGKESWEAYKNRLFIIDLRSGSIESMPVKEGAGRNGKRFGNREGDHTSPLGFHLASEISSSGKYGKYIALDGLENKNSETRGREVIIHSQYDQLFSYGCPVVANDKLDSLFSTIAGGSLVLNYHPSYTGPDFRANIDGVIRTAARTIENTNTSRQVALARARLPSDGVLQAMQSSSTAASSVQ